MFCTSLRRRSSFAPSIPSLGSSLALRESQLLTHDLDIRFSQTAHTASGGTAAYPRHLRLLLLSPSAVSENKLDESFKRIEHFASLTGGQDVAIVFLLNPPPVSTFVSAKKLAGGNIQESSKADGVHAYSKLQAEMINDAEMAYIPILPLSNLEGLAELIKTYMANLTRRPPKQKPAATSFELLQLCTASSPMSQHTAYILSDLFVDLRDLANACSSISSVPNSSSPSARASMSHYKGVNDLELENGSQDSAYSADDRLNRLRELVGAQELQDIVDFWRDEWVVE